MEVDVEANINRIIPKDSWRQNPSSLEKEQGVGGRKVVRKAMGKILDNLK